jgi:hypothetical protein
MLERPLSTVEARPPQQPARRRRTPKPPLLPKLDALIKGWHRLSRDELVHLVWQIQHLATGVHLSEAEWRIVDEMRQTLRSIGSVPVARTRRRGASPPR